jgi:hypothetical protein
MWVSYQKRNVAPRQYGKSPASKQEGGGPHTQHPISLKWVIFWGRILALLQPKKPIVKCTKAFFWRKFYKSRNILRKESHILPYLGWILKNIMFYFTVWPLPLVDDQ